jgi:hypothetical protein
MALMEKRVGANEINLEGRLMDLWLIDLGSEVPIVH